MSGAANSEPHVLVTGAAGFVGSWVVDALSKLGQRVTAASLIPAASAATSAKALKLDTTKRDDVFHAVRALQPTAVIHLAAVAEPRRATQDPVDAWEVNVNGTLNVAEAVLRYVPAAPLIFAGSSEAYGATFKRIPCVDETSPLEPVSAYGRTKVAAERVLELLAGEGVRVIRFRPFNHTGPGQSESYVVPSLARQIARIESGLQVARIEVGDLNARRDFLDVRDVVAAYLAGLACADHLQPGAVFNVASGTPVKIEAILDMLLSHSRAAKSIEVVTGCFPAPEISVTSGKADLARRCLGWSPRIPLETTVSDILNYWRARTRQAS